MKFIREVPGADIRFQPITYDELKEEQNTHDKRLKCRLCEKEIGWYWEDDDSNFGVICDDCKAGKWWD